MLEIVCHLSHDVSVSVPATGGSTERTADQQLFSQVREEDDLHHVCFYMFVLSFTE